MPDLTAREWYYKWATKIALGVLIPIGCWIYGWILVRMRAAVLHTQRVNSVAFAGDALRTTFSTLLMQYLILARFTGFAFNYPNGIFRGDCEFVDNMDIETNGSWAYSAPISSCKEDLFQNEPYPVPSKATVYSLYYGLNCKHILARALHMRTLNDYRCRQINSTGVCC